MYMKIRKIFTFEMAHIVRNAWSSRCAKNIHGHSYKIELILKGSDPDKGQMVIDFGLVKKYINPFIDSFDHSLCLWNTKEDKEIINFCKDHFERVIVTPFSTTAEMQAKMFYTFADIAIKQYLKKHKENGELECNVDSVIVHETTTGYGEYSLDRKDNFPIVNLSEIQFSSGIMSSWNDEFRKFYKEILKEN